MSDLTKKIRSIFDSPARVVLSRTEWLITLALFALGTLVCYFRQSPMERGTLWAEDGSIFVTEAWRPAAIFHLFDSYAGYLQIPPRVIAFVATRLTDSEHISQAIHLGAAISVSFICASIFIASRYLIQNPILRISLWILIVSTPLGGLELLGSIANLHWYFLVGLVWVLITRQLSWGETVIACAVIAAATTNDVLSLAFIPLVIVKLWAARSFRDALPSIVFFLTAAFQLLTVLNSTRQLAEVKPGIWATIDNYLFRVPFVTVTGLNGQQFADFLGNWPTRGIAIATMSVVVFAILIGIPHRYGLVVLAGSSVLFFSFVLWLTGGFYLLPTPRVLAVERYAFTALLLFLGALLISFDRILTRYGSTPIAKVLVFLGVGYLLFVGIRDYQVHQWESGPKSISESFRLSTCETDNTAHIQILPPGNWFVQIPCKQ